MKLYDAYQNFCEHRKKTHQFRALRESLPRIDGHALIDGQNLINFSSNDYLGLSQHPSLIKAAQSYAERYGAGSTASRHISGNNPHYASIESKIARGKGTEAALLMNSGYQANITVLAALADAEVVGKAVHILADRLCHNSLLQGAILSGAQLKRFHHNDYAHLESLLQQQKEKGTHIIIVTESVFGMDGDRADLKALTDLASRYEAMLYVDEAHATGLYGSHGFGLASDYKGQIDIIMGTCGKALGSFGAYIASSQIIRDYLIQRCGGLIYSTALPPAILGSIEAALDLLPHLNKERDYLEAQSKRLRQALCEQGWDCAESTTQIIPIILGHEEAATHLSEQLKLKGFFVPAIRPPTVPRGTSRLRISLSAAHKADDIDRLINAMASLKANEQKALAS
ncbi:MAG: 8-amino-7-oxononanoate synthase [Alphaproteobacteria bacterium]